MSGDLTAPHSPETQSAHRVLVEGDGRLPTELLSEFRHAFMQVFGTRRGTYRVAVREGDRVGHVEVQITATGRARPVVLFFPEARGLDRSDVARILANVIEGSGPGFV
jgi:hypothetical protein